MCLNNFVQDCSYHSQDDHINRVEILSYKYVISIFPSKLEFSDMIDRKMNKGTYFITFLFL